jgi:hypothetical protein
MINLTNIHRLIQERRHEAVPAHMGIPENATENSRMDKMLMHFLHAMFVIALSIFWNRYRTDPHEFGFIASLLMVAFSVLVLISIASSVY